MELYQIRYFLALCETLNFARAAERCGVCQPSMTRAIQKLERELGGVLIRRERRLTHLTELGLLVRPMLSDVLAHAERTKSAARCFVDTAHKPVRLGLMRSIGPSRLAPFLARFAAQQRDIELTLVEADARGLSELMLGGGLELAVSAPAGPISERLHLHRLYEERLVVAFASSHRFAQHQAVPLVQLRNEPLVVRSDCEMATLLSDACRRRGFEPNIVQRSEREEWVMTMVAARCGVTVMPDDAHLGKATLTRPLIDPEIARDVSLITVAGRPHDARVQRLVRTMRAHKWAEAPAAIERPSFAETQRVAPAAVEARAH